MLTLSPGSVSALADARGERVARMVRWTGLPASAVVAVTPDIAVAVIRRGVRSGDIVEGVELQGEIVDESLEPTRTWRSMRTVLDATCHTRTVRIDRMDVFPQHDRKGAPTPARTPTGWIQPSPEAYLSDVLAAVCDHAPPAGERIAAVQSKAPPSAPVAAAPPDAPARLTPVTDLVAAPPTISGAALVQIAALPTREEAQAALKALTDRTPLSAGLEARIEEAVVHGRRWRRAQVTGFASIEDAQRFCATVRGAGGTCFVR